MKMHDLLIAERIFECFQGVGVYEVLFLFILLWLLRIVTSGLCTMSVNVMCLWVMFHWRTLWIILKLREIFHWVTTNIINIGISQACIYLPVHCHNLGHLWSEVCFLVSLCPSFELNWMLVMWLWAIFGFWSKIQLVIWRVPLVDRQ